MSFNELPLDLKIKINLLLYEHTNPNLTLSHEHKGNTIYQIPKYNKYCNEIISLFDFIDTGDTKFELGQFFDPSVFTGIFRNCCSGNNCGHCENISYTVFNIYKITPKTIFYEYCEGFKNMNGNFITERKTYRRPIKQDPKLGYYFNHYKNGGNICRNDLYSPFIGPLPQ